MKPMSALMAIPLLMSVNGIAQDETKPHTHDLHAFCATRVDVSEPLLTLFFHFDNILSFENKNPEAPKPPALVALQTHWQKELCRTRDAMQAVAEPCPPWGNVYTRSSHWQKPMGLGEQTRLSFLELVEVYTTILDLPALKSDTNPYGWGIQLKNLHDQILAYINSSPFQSIPQDVSTRNIWVKNHCAFLNHAFEGIYQTLYTLGTAPASGSPLANSHKLHFSRSFWKSQIEKLLIILPLPNDEPHSGNYP